MIITPTEFNEISECAFADYKCLAVWIEYSDHKPYTRKELRQIKFLKERLLYMNNIHFVDSDIKEIALTLLEYNNGDEEKRKKILSEYLK